MSKPDDIVILARDVMARTAETPWGTTPALLDMRGSLSERDVVLDVPFTKDDLLDLLPDHPGGDLAELAGGIAPDDGPAYAFWSHGDIVKILGEGEPVILANANGSWRDPPTFVEAVLATRKAIGPSRLLAVLGVATPQNLPFLAYLGVDVLDPSLVSMIATQGITFTGVVAARSPGTPEEESVDSLARMVRRTRELITSGRLREVVEGTASFSTKVRQGLFHCDTVKRAHLEYAWPVGRRPFTATSDLSLRRMDIIRFLERLRERYVPPRRELLLLLPCSAAKPYSNSRTHRAFANVLSDTGRRGHVHEVIITSPVGVVPRDLETLHPAVSYDIAVTGEWTGAEKEMILENLRVLMEKGEYEHVVVHLPVGMEFVKEAIDPSAVTCTDHPLTRSSLDNLRRTVKELTKGLPPVSKGRMLLDDLTALATHQFGGAGKMLTEGAAARRVRNNPALFVDGKQVAALSPERGCLVLTKEGAGRLLDTEAYRVMIDDFRPRGDVFAVGVIDATEDIRIGDEVLIVHHDELRGIGIAEMTPSEMRELKRGTAVRMRHSVR